MGTLRRETKYNPPRVHIAVYCAFCRSTCADLRYREETADYIAKCHGKTRIYITAPALVFEATNGSEMFLVMGREIPPHVKDAIQ